jgi:hypothetical protein
LVQDDVSNQLAKLKLSAENAKEVNAFLDTIIDFEGIAYLIPSNGLEEEDPKSMILVRKRRRNDDDREDRLLTVKPSTQFSSLGRTMRVPEDFFLDPGDSLYLHYFMEEFSEVFSLGIMSGTRPLWNMLSRALEHLPLRYTLIAVSAWLYDGIAGRSRERSVANLRKAIPMIQSAVTSTALDDGHGFAVFLLAYLSVVRGDVKGISLHVGGFYRILRHCNVLREDGSPNSNHTSLAMILWRIGVRTDNIIGVVGQRATFPATTVPDSFHSNWLRDFDNPERPDTAEWAMAQFALDDLANRATHLAVRSITIQRKIERGDHDAIEELNVELDMAFLIRDLEAWKRRRILREAESRERARRVALPSQPPLKFLEYEPLTFADEAYAIMLVQYFTCRIQLSLVTNPQIGPYPAERHMFAVELCRVYAAIGGLKKPGLSGLLVGLVYAALALTDKTCPLGIASHPHKLTIRICLDSRTVSGYRQGCRIFGWFTSDPNFG